MYSIIDMLKPSIDYEHTGRWRTTRDGAAIAFRYELVDDKDRRYDKLIGNLEKSSETVNIRTNWRLPFDVKHYITLQDGTLYTIIDKRTVEVKNKQSSRVVIRNPQTEYILSLSVIDNTMGIK